MHTYNFFIIAECISTFLRKKLQLPLHQENDDGRKKIWKTSALLLCPWQIHKVSSTKKPKEIGLPPCQHPFLFVGREGKKESSSSSPSQFRSWNARAVQNPHAQTPKTLSFHILLPYILVVRRKSFDGFFASIVKQTGRHVSLTIKKEDFFLCSKFKPCAPKVSGQASRLRRRCFKFFFPRQIDEGSHLLLIILVPSSSASFPAPSPNYPIDHLEIWHHGGRTSIFLLSSKRSKSAHWKGERGGGLTDLGTKALNKDLG